MPIANGMEVFPGDPQVDISRVKTLKKDGLVLSKICMGLHTGTHIDAPMHYLPGGKGIDRIPLGSLTGKALVCDLSDRASGISGKDLKAVPIQKGDIVFLKTENRQTRRKEGIYLQLTGAEHLVKNKVKAVGIDRLSIEKPASEDASVHKLLLGREIPVIEGLVLEHVAGGRYLAHCSPLRIKGGEAAPARCVLVETSESP